MISVDALAMKVVARELNPSAAELGAPRRVPARVLAFPAGRF
jgi:hypothetical protein